MRIALFASVASLVTVFAAGCGSAEGSIGNGEDPTQTGDDSGQASPTDDTGGSAVDDDSGTAPAPDSGSGGPADTGSATKDTGTATKDTGTAQPDTGGSTTPDTGAPGLDGWRVTCVDEINRYRATLSLPPYAGWTSAGTCADGQSKSDSESGKAHGTFGKCGESAQNECPGWPGPPDSMIKGCLKMMWAEGPGEPFSAHGHYINMSSTSYKSVACGFYQTPSGSWWSVQDFR